ncbi:sigma-70 family RNA polymerase sigma factor [Fulvivirgaceae bacterium BMA10]|uniref:Sigma-70 family RNA polymerase sigma factor n=1 Tax=Splendidivirga corallicola TaxID=3051826 RepID=A0ABT8KQB8_9BACT|nr:sigma-70 family RNA polymerase sigma factor [Fulvivirgaceae bacterium BMA10]
MAEDTELIRIIEGCKKGNLKSQEMLYKHFYGYAMSACLVYANSKDDALEILNDGFLKIFSHITKHDPNKSLKGWIRRIMVNTAIDHYRKNAKHYNSVKLENAIEVVTPADIYSHISAEEIVEVVQELTPGYRMVFSLYVIEGYSHKEIGKKLGIAESTSRANLVMANRKLRGMLEKRYRKENV